MALNGKVFRHWRCTSSGREEASQSEVMRAPPALARRATARCGWRGFFPEEGLGHAIEQEADERHAGGKGGRSTATFADSG